MATRTEAVERAMGDIRAIEGRLGVTREGVAAIRDRLIEMAASTSLFGLDDFPPPGSGEKRSSRLYRLSQDDDDRYALYAQASRGQVETPPHNHTTWAVVVGFHGQELNRFYKRTGDGVTETRSQVVQAGTGVAMLPADLHSIHIDGPALNFHCYGLALERLDAREYYDRVEQRWKSFAAVGTIHEARSHLLSC